METEPVLFRRIPSSDGTKHKSEILLKRCPWKGIELRFGLPTVQTLL